MRRWICTATWTTLLFVTMATSKECAEKYTAYVVVDGSESISSSNFLTVKNALKKLVNQSIIRSDDIRIGIVVYSTGVTNVLSASSNITSLANQIDAIIHPSEGTDTHMGIERARELLLSDTSSPMVMIVITDGLSRYPKRTAQAASQARAAGITMVAVGIDESVKLVKSYYEKFLNELHNITGSQNLVFQIERFGSLADEVLKISQFMCIPIECLSQVSKTAERDFHIEKTVVGETFFTTDLCGVDKRPLGQIACLENGNGGAMWGTFVLNQACNFSDLQISNVSDILRKLSLMEVNNTNIEDVLQTASNKTKNTTLTELDLYYITTILENTKHVTDVSCQVLKDWLEICSRKTKNNEAILLQSQLRGNVANRILESLDTLTAKLSPNPTGNSRCITDSFWSEVWDFTADESMPTGLKLTSKSSDSALTTDSAQLLFKTTDLDVSETDTAIILPGDIWRRLREGSKSSRIRLSMNIYTEPCLFRMSQNSQDDLTKYTLNSKVISAKILIDGRQITDLNGKVKIVFMPEVILPETDRRTLTACGYWNFTGNDNSGSWSNSGCRYSKLDEGRDVCVCDHLTNFAVLLDFYGQRSLPTVHEVSLSIITIIGLSLSIFGLSATVLSFIVFRKLRQSYAQLTLLNLALAELCSWIVFLAGINQIQCHVVCIVVAALLHYFILASFMWMLAEAVLHYRLLVKVLGTYTSRYMLKTGIPAWVIPLVPVGIVLAIDVNLYRGGETYCWMSKEALYYSFALPVGLIILCNMILYIIVVVNICRRSNVNIRDSSNNRAFLTIRESIVCFVLLGLSWIFGFLAISDARIVFQYIFCITNTIQGFIIFIFFIARKKVREIWRELCCKKKEGFSKSTKSRSSDLTLNKRSSDIPLNKRRSDPHLNMKNSDLPSGKDSCVMPLRFTQCNESDA